MNVISACKISCYALFIMFILLSLRILLCCRQPFYFLTCLLIHHHKKSEQNILNKNIIHNKENDNFPQMKMNFDACRNYHWHIRNNSLGDKEELLMLSAKCITEIIGRKKSKILLNIISS